MGISLGIGALLALAGALLAPHVADAQDRSGLLGGGIAYYDVAGRGSGVGFRLDVAANINRIHSSIQYRLFIAYAGFREDGPLPACTVEQAVSCPLEPARHGQLSIGWAPTLAAADRGTLRLRLAPIGVGVLVRESAGRLRQRQQCGTFSTIPGCEDGHRIAEELHSSVELGYGLRSGIELGLHVRPVVVQLAAHWQHSLGGAPGYVAVPLSVGYFF